MNVGTGRTGKIISAVFCMLNLFAIVALAVLAALGGDGAAGTVFGALCLAVLCADVIYAAIQKRLALTRITVSVLAVVLDYAVGISTGLSVFADSKNIFGLVLLIAAYAVNGALGAYAVFGKGTGREIKRLKPVCAAVGAAGLLATAIAAVVMVATPTYAATNAVNTAAVFITLCAAFLSLVIYGAPPKAVLAAASLLAVAGIVPTAINEGAAFSDAERAVANVESVFGQVPYEEGMLKAPYDFSLEFFGISTENYTLERDKVYFDGEDIYGALTLKYDAYYPNVESRGVLINLHGSGGDKDTGNYAHRNKYFASRGYTVFDIQYGDYNEADTGDERWFSSDTERVEFLLRYIDEFIVYASGAEEAADWNNLFITGVSMGGTSASRYALSYGNSLDTLENVTLRGIIPVYPGYSSEDEGVLDCLGNLSNDSTPCLVVMGLYDKVVPPTAAGEYKAAYDAAGAKCAAVEISFAGHSCDYFMSGRSNQLITYCAERFMAALSV